jgi:hypothetical protein
VIDNSPAFHLWWLPHPHLDFCSDSSAPPSSPPLSSLQITDSLDEKLAALGTERERSLLLDIERREQNVANLFMKAARLSAPLPLASFDIPFEHPPSSSYCVGVDGTPLDHVTACNSERSVPYLSHSLSTISLSASSAVESNEADRRSDVNSSSSPLDDLAASTAAVAAENAADVIDDYTFMVQEFFPPRAIGLKQVCPTAAPTATPTAAPIFYKSEEEESQQFKEEVIPPNDQGSVPVKVVFDGPNRTICDFIVKLPPPPMSIRVSELNSVEEEKEKKAEVSAEEREEEEDWVSRHLICPETLNQDSEGVFSYGKASVEVELGSYSAMDAEETVILGDKVSTC